MQARTRSLLASAALFIASLATLVSSPVEAQSKKECVTDYTCYSYCPTSICSSCSELALVCRTVGEVEFICAPYEVMAFCQYWS